jgi:hypothetical protein
MAHSQAVSAAPPPVEGFPSPTGRANDAASVRRNGAALAQMSITAPTSLPGLCICKHGEALGPGGAASCSQGRETLVDWASTPGSPGGATSTFTCSTDVAPHGARIVNDANFQGLAPLATRLGPSGAACRCIILLRGRAGGGVTPYQRRSHYEPESATSANAFSYSPALPASHPLPNPPLKGEGTGDCFLVFFPRRATSTRLRRRRYAT